MDWTNAVFTIVTSVLCSMIASFIFWTLSFKASTTKIEFSSKIERSYRDNKFKLRVRFINIGPADLFDIRYLARLMYRSEKKGGLHGRGTAVYLDLGQRSVSPILFGKKEQMKRKHVVFSWTVALSESEDFYRVFSRAYHPDHIRKKAETHTLTFDDIIGEYQDNLTVRIFAFGIDSMTGVEKMFMSPHYTIKDIVTGHFNSANVSYKKYKDYVSHILSIKSSENS